MSDSGGEPDALGIIAILVSCASFWWAVRTSRRVDEKRAVDINRLNFEVRIQNPLVVKVREIQKLRRQLEGIGLNLDGDVFSELTKINANSANHLTDIADLLTEAHESRLYHTGAWAHVIQYLDDTYYSYMQYCLELARHRKFSDEILTDGINKTCASLKKIESSINARIDEYVIELSAA